MSVEELSILRDILDKDISSILKGKSITDPPHVFPGKDAENYWRLRSQLGEASAVRAIKIADYYRQLESKTRKDLEKSAEQASLREKKLRAQIDDLSKINRNKEE